jgi:uncharacterized membrane protein
MGLMLMALCRLDHAIPMRSNAVIMFSPARSRYGLLRLLAMLAAASWMSLPAAASLKLCNKTAARIGVAFGQANQDTLTSEGWFNLKPGSCEDIVSGDLAEGPYFIHAIDYDRGGEWGGQDLMCISDTEFKIDGSADCYARGYTRAGFRRIETNGQKHWSIDLTDGNRSPAGGME